MVNIFNYCLAMIARSIMNERSPDMTPNDMSLKKDTTNI
jgi:hypothetical protein